MSVRATEPRAWWHGCWLEPGHYLFDRRGNSGRRIVEACPLGRDSMDAPWLDGGLAPRRVRPGARSPVDPLPGGIVCTRMGGERNGDRDVRAQIERCSDEGAQGEFLLHAINGCTIAAWWDRTQGDTRGACNSCLIVENEVGRGSCWSANEMLELFPRLFPVQAERLAMAGVTLRFLRWAGAAS